MIDRAFSPAVLCAEWEHEQDFSPNFWSTVTMKSFSDCLTPNDKGQVLFSVKYKSKKVILKLFVHSFRSNNFSYHFLVYVLVVFLPFWNTVELFSICSIKCNTTAVKCLWNQRTSTDSETANIAKPLFYAAESADLHWLCKWFLELPVH